MNWVDSDVKWVYNWCFYEKVSMRPNKSETNPQTNIEIIIMKEKSSTHCWIAHRAFMHSSGTTSQEYSKSEKVYTAMTATDYFHERNNWIHDFSLF